MNQSLKNFRDWYSALSTAEKKGFETGIEKGFEKGIEQGIEKGIEQGIEQGIEKGLEMGIEKGLREANLNNARNLKNLGVATSIISQATGLSKEEIDNSI